MRGTVHRHLTPEEATAIDVLTEMEENKKWQRFFRFYLVTFVANITGLMALTDFSLEEFRSLRQCSTAESFMRIVDSLIHVFDSCALDGSDHPVSVAFKDIVPSNDREFLLPFSEGVALFCITNPDTTDEMIYKLYALRNYYLMKDELARLFIDLQNDDLSHIHEYLPRDLLEKLGFIPIFPFL